MKTPLFLLPKDTYLTQGLFREILRTCLIPYKPEMVRNMPNVLRNGVWKNAKLLMRQDNDVKHYSAECRSLLEENEISLMASKWRSGDGTHSDVARGRGGHMTTQVGKFFPTHSPGMNGPIKKIGNAINMCKLATRTLTVGKTWWTSSKNSGSESNSSHQKFFADLIIW